MKPKSKFDKWFKAQFGRLPDFAATMKQTQRVANLQRELRDAEAWLAALHNIEDKYEAASLAKNAAPDYEF